MASPRLPGRAAFTGEAAEGMAGREVPHGRPNLNGMLP